MLLVEVVKPWFIEEGMYMFDRKIGVWPLVNTIYVKGNPKILYQNNELPNKL